MATRSDLSSDEVAALEYAPVFAAENLVAKGVDRFGSGFAYAFTQGSGSVGAVNLINTTNAGFAYDGRLTRTASPLGGSGAATTFHIQGELSPGAVVDTMVLGLDATDEEVTIQLFLANNDGFSGAILSDSINLKGPGRVAFWGIPVSGTLSRISESGGNMRFRVAVTFASAVANTALQVQELFLGRFRLFSRPWLNDQPYQDLPTESIFEETQGLNRSITRRTRAEGMADDTYTMDLLGTVETASGTIGLDRITSFDDLVTLRALAREGQSGASTLWYRNGSSGSTLLVGPTSPIQAPVGAQESWRRFWTFSYIEQPPFASQVLDPLQPTTPPPSQITFTAAQQVNGTGSVFVGAPSATAYLQVHVFGTNETLSDATTSITYGGVSPSLSDQNLHRFAFGPTRGYQYTYGWTPADVAAASGTALTVVSALADVMYLIRWVDGPVDTTPGIVAIGGASKGGPSWSGQNAFRLVTSVFPQIDGSLFLGAFMAEGPFSMAYSEGQKTSDGQFFPAGGTYTIETGFARTEGTDPDRIEGTGSGDIGNFGDQGNTGGIFYQRAPEE